MLFLLELPCSAYHPQSNGLDQTLNSSLQRLVNEHRDEFIDDDVFAYRTSRQDSTKYTPFFLMHGREARPPVDVQYLRCITQYGSTVYIGMAMGGSAL